MEYHVQEQTLVWVLYDSIENSVFESQVITPILKKLAHNQKLQIILVSFEKYSQEAIPKNYYIILENIKKKQARFSYVIYKKSSLLFLKQPNFRQEASKINSILQQIANSYQLQARGPLASLICYRALTTNSRNCTSFIIQARGLLAEEYRYTHKHETNFFKKIIYRVRYYQLKLLEKYAYTRANNTKLAIPMHIEAVSYALQEYLVKTCKLAPNMFFIAHDDIPEKLSLETRTNFRTTVRTQLKTTSAVHIDNTTHLYLYSGSCKPWQYPEETINYFCKKNRKNNNSFLLILTTEPDNFKKLLIKKNIPPKKYLVASVNPSEVIQYACAADTGILFREPDIINWVSRPTKLLEYQAAHLNIAHNNTIKILENS